MNATPVEDGPDRETLEAICSPAADRLRREPPGAFVPEPPDREGQAREGGRREHERREHQHLQPPGRRELVIYLREHERQRNEQSERKLGQPNPVERPVIAPRALDFLLREDLVKHG